MTTGNDFILNLLRVAERNRLLSRKTVPSWQTLMNESSTMSKRSDTWPMLPQILAWMEGYISSSSIVIVISLSRISDTFCRRLSSPGFLQNLQKRASKVCNRTVHDLLRSVHDIYRLPVLNNTDLVRFGSQGVMYSRHKCFISMLELRNPWMHSSKNSRVSCGSFMAKRLLMELMKIVLFDGMHNPAIVIVVCSFEFTCDAFSFTASADTSWWLKPKNTVEVGKYIGLKLEIRKTISSVNLTNLPSPTTVPQSWDQKSEWARTADCKRLIADLDPSCPSSTMQCSTEFPAHPLVGSLCAQWRSPAREITTKT